MTLLRLVSWRVRLAWVLVGAVLIAILIIWHG